MKLLIVSHVPHYPYQGSYWAYGPYAKEIEIWADLFAEVVISAPVCDEPPPQDAHRIGKLNVRLAPQERIDGMTWRSRLHAAVAIPGIVFGLIWQMQAADAIHVRCPGNIGLLGALLAPLFSRCLIAKYAGQWDGFPGEKWTVRLQRAILGSRWWKGPVTVYGSFVKQPPHVVSFFTSMMSTAQLRRAKDSLAKRSRPSIMTVAYSGRLTRAKNVDKLLQAVAGLNAEGRPMKALIIGNGPEFESLQRLAVELGIRDFVEFTGGIHPELVPDFLERADVFVLASDTEGWPKALAEAMAFGLICIGSDLGLIPMFLADGRGFTIPPRNTEALMNALRQIAIDPEALEAMRVRASEWAVQYSFESLRDALGDLIARHWKLASPRMLQLKPDGVRAR